VFEDPLSAYCFTLRHIDNQGLINTPNERYKMANLQVHIKVLVIQMIHSGIITSLLLLLVLLCSPLSSSLLLSKARNFKHLYAA